jgi:hypothetical protein
VEKQCDDKINQSNMAPRYMHKVKVDFGWKIWLFFFFLMEKPLS